MTGTVLNVIGGSIGTVLGNRLPAKVQETVLRGLGLMVLVIGGIMASGMGNVLIPLVRVANLLPSTLLHPCSFGSLAVRGLASSRESVRAIRRLFCLLENCER